MLEGDEVWAAGDAGRWSWRLLEAALSRTDSPRGLTEEDGRTQDLIGSGELKRLVEKPAAYFIEYADGLKATLLMLNGALKDFCVAVKLAGEENPLSTQFLLTPRENVTYSACLVAKIEDMVVSGNAPFPADRTMLVSGMLEACLTSRVQGFARLETPKLLVGYQPPKESQHAQR
jgi:hypothetical protein